MHLDDNPRRETLRIATFVKIYFSEKCFKDVSSASRKCKIKDDVTDKICE